MNFRPDHPRSLGIVHCIAVLLVALSCITSSLASDTTRVLFVGNSYVASNDLAGIFRQLSASMGEVVETAIVAPGGYTYELHSTYPATQAAFASGTWDVVVLQEQSQLPSFSPAQVATAVFPYATLLAQQIRQGNACAEVVYLMTWGRENGDALNCASYPPVCTYEGMQQRLRDSYVQMAVDNSAVCGAAGAVWRAFRSASPGVGLYSDGSHPNIVGSYLVANALASTIFRRSTVAASYIPTSIDPDLAGSVRALSSMIIADSAAVWNIGVNDPDASLAYTDLGGGTVQFASNTAGAVSNHWDFGDGASSPEFDPLHVYSSEGTYTVTLVSADSCGRSDSASVDITIAFTGLADVDGMVDLSVRYDPDGRVLRLLDNPVAGKFELMDSTGRIILSQLVKPGGTQIQLDAHWRGAYLWRYIRPGTRSSSGRVIIP